MNTSTFALFIFVNLLALPFLTAQDRLSQPVNFTCRSCQPGDALIQLSRQTGVNIAFNDRFFNRCENIDIDARNEPMARLLERISACAKVSFKYDGTQVVFFRKNSKYTLSGYVLDAETGERLIGASIRAMADKNIGAVTNEYGFFSLQLDEGVYEVSISYIGYRQERTSLDMQRDRLMRFRLQTDNNLPEVVVSDLNDPETKRQKGGSPKYLAGSDLKSLPMPGGEADLIRQTALQPGIQTGVDGLGGLHVRGGNADHNLFLLDDVPVYSPSHAIGLFSIYNPSIVNSIRLWKGDFPARYGGRVASVLDVRSRDGNFKNYHASVAAGLFASSAAVEGPLVKDKSSFLLAVRSTYLGPWVDFFSKKGNLLNFSGDKVNYRFYDANLKLNYVLSDRDRVYISYYTGGDRFRNDFDQLYSDPDALITDRYNVASDWGNAIAAVRWNHLLNNKLFTNSTLRYSRFNYGSQLSFNSEALYYPSNKYEILYDYAQLYQTLIRDISGKTDFTFYVSNKLTLRWGAAVTQHNFQPGALSINFQLPGQSPTSIDSLENILQNNERVTANETEAYFDSEFEPLKNLHIEAGLNGSVFQGKNVNYRFLQPRFRARWGKATGWNVWGGYHQMAQYLHQIGSFNVSLPFELWVPSTRKVQPELVRQFSGGISWQNRGWTVQAEAYDKNLDRVFTFLSSNDALFTGGAEDASGWEDRIASGTGRSRGIELVLEKTSGFTTGSIAYTFSKTTRTFPEINSGREFLFRFDRPNDLKITVQQRVNNWLDVSAIWAFATGNPITLTGVKYRHESVEGEIEREVYVYTEVNGYRLPNYHRLDLAMNLHFNRKKLKHDFQLGVYNVYNRSNPFYLSIDTASEIRGKAIQYTLLPLLPVFRYEIKI